jgi:ankyrin repeat protein
VIEALRMNPKALDAIDGTDCMPLHWAAQAGDLEALAKLLRAGASINIMVNQGRTPLMQVSILNLVNSRYGDYIDQSPLSDLLCCSLAHLPG